MSNTDYLNSFPRDTTDAWRERVDRELKGKSYEDFLIWKSNEGFENDAWQNSRPSPLPHLIAPNEPWKIVEPVYATDAQDANKTALDALNVGAEAVWFQKSFLGAAAQVASQGIDEKIAPVFIRNGNIIDPFQSLLKSGRSNETSGEATTHFIDGNRLRERGAGVIDELAILLSQAIELGEKTNFEKQPLFITGTGNAFLTEVAKLRALRWLWLSILQKEGETTQNASILAKNLTIGYAQNDEHTNILRATSSAMSSVIGGAQYVMIEPWDKSWKDQNNFSSRISRNIQNLLKEEARLDKNLNPADGSYLIENLTVKIAKMAWKKVNEIERKGGFTEYAKSGDLKTDLNQSRAKQIDDYKNNRSILLGVNKFQPSSMKAENKKSASQYELLPDLMDLPFALQNQQS